MAARVDVEVVLLRWDAAGALCYRELRGPLIDGEPPDEAALRLAAAPAAAVSHSTSWRFEVPDRIVLTYAVLPDPDPTAPATPLSQPAVLCSGDPRRPAPDDVHDHHVAAHAVRHLAYLAEHDPGVAGVRSADPAVWAHLARAAAAMPTGTHAEAHARAGGIAAGPGAEANPE